MKKIIFSLIVTTMTMTVTECDSNEGFIYLENTDSISPVVSRGLHDAHIILKDELTITVNTTDPDAAAPFNLQVCNQLGSSKQIAPDGGSLQGYLIDSPGFINFPIIGKTHVSSLTEPECEDLIKSKIQPYLARTKNPIVTAHMGSCHTIVLGEVGHPGVILVSTEEMSVLEAIVRAGDLGVYGKRNNTMLICEDLTGQKCAVRLGPNDANLLNLPYYYLQQNDVLHVQPNSIKAKNSGIGNSTTFWFSLIGTVTPAALLFVNILRK